MGKLWLNEYKYQIDSIKIKIELDQMNRKIKFDSQIEIKTRITEIAIK